MGVEELGHCVFLRIVPQANEIQVVLGNILKAPDHSRLLPPSKYGSRLSSSTSP
jgi:hypothetical protein